MPESDNDATKKPRVKHDWTFFFFITIAFILVAAAITWASAKSGMFTGIEQEDTTSYSDSTQ